MKEDFTFGYLTHSEIYVILTSINKYIDHYKKYFPDDVVHTGYGVKITCEDDFSPLSDM
jgi:putative salt-induced outer membrane protein YdiY